MLAILGLVLLLAWLLVCARLSRRDEIADMQHGPDLETEDRRVALRAERWSEDRRVALRAERWKRRGLLK